MQTLKLKDYAMVAICQFLIATTGACAKSPVPLEPALPEERQVGIAYSTLHKEHWHQTWDTPKLGQYLTTDPKVIRQHAGWLSDANIDFIYIDWSNDIDTGAPGAPYQADQTFIENSTKNIFDEYANLSRHPKVAIMIGFPGAKEALTDGRLQRKADQVWRQFASNPTYQNTYFHYLHHPLLIVYTGTPTPFNTGLPKWSDPRFTVRYMTGFVSQQKSLLGPDGVSRYGYWSWEDRGAPTVAAWKGKAEVMTVVAAWRGDTHANIAAQGRNDGKTFNESWQYARKVGPKFVLAGTFNEWAGEHEDPSAEVSKDIEPSQIFGDRYLNILGKQAAEFKAGR
jgi:hypothetical protein